MKQHAGIANPHFFIGVVENNVDERKEGRVQVRVFGVHGTIDEIPTLDLPWAIVLTGGGSQFAAVPLNSWVFGVFIDGRDAQQPLVIGVIPQQYRYVINPAQTGWGVVVNGAHERLAQGTRPQDFGQPSVPRLARGENLEETGILGQETNRKTNIGIGGGGNDNLQPMDNLGVMARDDGEGSPADVAGSVDDVVKAAVPNIISIESNWNPNAKNPSSSASGLGQFIDSTWLSMMSKYRPDITGSKQELLDMRYDADLSIEMTTHFTQENYNYLSSQGLSVDQGSLYLAHFLGAGGAAQVLRQGDSMRIGDIVSPSVISANRSIRHNGKSFADFTVADIKSWSNTKMGSQSAPSSEVARVNSGTATKPTTQTISEPSTAYNAQYPYNRVIETAAGHTFEMDDTPGAERIMLHHSSGAYVQLAPETTTYKSTKDTFDINDRNWHLYVGGIATITVDGDCHVLVKGNKVEEIMGDSKLIVHGNHETTAAGTVNINGGDDAQIRAARVSMESNVENTNVKVGKVLRFETTETIHFKTKNMFFSTEETMNMTVGTDFIMKVGGKLSLASDSAIYAAAADAIHMKSEDIRIGDGDGEVSIKADTVKIDDVVRMAEGASEAAEASGLTPIAAEAATTVTAGAPTTRALPNSGPK